VAACPCQQAVCGCAFSWVLQEELQAARMDTRRTGWCATSYAKVGPCQLACSPCLLSAAIMLVHLVHTVNTIRPAAGCSMFWYISPQTVPTS
jgi:hypothetical protein